MLLLVSPSLVLKRMSVAENADVLEGVRSAIPAAQVYYESVLATKFTAGAAVDYFELKSSLFWPTLPANIAKLRLRNAFVLASPVPTITVYDTYSDMMADEGGTTVDPTGIIDAVRGIVRLNALEYDDVFVKVTYSYGFTLTDPQDENTVSPTVPDWLQEAIISYVPSVMNTQQTTNRSEEAQKLTDEAKKHGEEAVQPYLRRNIPFAFLPI